ncbi:MAG: DUF4846 domain-containing protein [Bacillota bacterium]
MAVFVAGRETGKKLYMLAKSYMPAQNIQVLANPNDKGLSPWYVLDDQQEDILMSFNCPSRQVISSEVRTASLLDD